MAWIISFIILFCLALIFRNLRLLLFMLLFMGLGALYFALSDIVSSPSVEEIIAQRDAMTKWPTVAGQLEEIHFKKDIPHGKGAYWYRATVVYQYSVNGKGFTGNKLGIQDYANWSEDELESQMHKFFSPKNIFKREDNKDSSLFGMHEISLSLINQPVQVYYDPKTPESSILDPHDYQPPDMWDVFAFRMALITIGLVLVVVPIIRWRRVGSALVPTPVVTRPEACTDESDWYEWLAQGEYLLSEGKYQEAIASLDRSNKDNPSEPGTWQYGSKALLLKAECLILLGKRTEGKKYFDQEVFSLKGKDIPWLNPIINRVRELLES